MSQQHHVKRIGLFGWCLLLFLIACVLPMAVAQNGASKAEETAKPAEMQAAETTVDPNTPPRLDYVERDGKFYIQGKSGEIPVEPLSVAPAGTKAEPQNLAPAIMQRSKLAARLAILSREDFAARCPTLSQQYADTGWAVDGIFRDGAFDKAGVCPDDILIGVGNWKINSQEAFKYFTGHRYERDENLKVWIIRKDRCYYVDVFVPAWQEPTEGVDTVAGIFTHIVTFVPQGDFAPRNPMQMLNVIRPALVEHAVHCGYFRTKPENGKLTGMFLTSDPDAFQKMIESLEQFEFVKAERLTRETFEAYDKTKQLSLMLQPDDGGFVTPEGGYTHLITFGPKGDFTPENPMQYLSLLNPILEKQGVSCGYFRSKPIDGKLIAMNLTDDPESYKKVVESIPQFEYIKTERLTKEMFEAYEKTYQESLPPADGGFVAAGSFTHIVTFIPKGDFAPRAPSLQIQLLLQLRLKHPPT